jgi:hypothetical protein
MYECKSHDRNFFRMQSQNLQDVGQILCFLPLISNYHSSHACGQGVRGHF